ncbi:MAG: AAA family ATPase [Phascolarctobacterium sp.]|nr:AAA family ATPase [Phascolarctobacterium sp.]
MKLKKLTLQNFRCYDDVQIEFEDKLTVIVGENGKGKSAIFDGIAISLAPYVEAFAREGRIAKKTDVRRVPVYDESGKEIVKMEKKLPVSFSLEALCAEGNICGRIEFDGKETNCEQNEFQQYAQSLQKQMVQDKQTILPAFAYYGTGRIWVDSNLLKEKEIDLLDRAFGYDECLEPSGSYTTFGSWYRHLTKTIASAEGEEQAKYKMIQEAVCRAMDACLKSISLSNIDYNKKLDTFVVTHPNMGQLLVDNLSDGFRAIISMAADLAYRMVRLNPQLGAKAVTDTPGIVLIDEIDMHLHPLWQQTVLTDLMQAFPSLQFIVTTHSPQVLSSVPAQSIRVLAWSNKFEGIRYVDFSYGADTLQILSDIQNVGSRSKNLPIVQDLERYLELVGEDKWDSEEALALRKKLDAWSNGHEPALVKADMDIRLRKFRRTKK